MVQVAVLNVQPNLDFNEASKQLISFQEVNNVDIGLERLYELINCNSRMIERIILGKLPNGNFLDLIIDEEGTFGQWHRGIKIKNQDGYEYTILGNCVFVQSTLEGDWIGWRDEIQMADALRQYIHKIKFFELSKSQL